MTQDDQQVAWAVCCAMSGVAVLVNLWNVRRFSQRTWLIPAGLFLVTFLVCLLALVVPPYSDVTPA